MKLLVFGSSGQVGSALKNMRPDAVFLSRHDVDLENNLLIRNFLEKQRPEVVVNAAAYTNVAQAEKEEVKALKINADAPETMACWAAQNSAVFIMYSTDYVFDGHGSEPFKEADKVRPLNAYGRTKLEGELKVLAQKGKNFIFRTSWVYDRKGKNFVNTMLKLAQERSEIKVVNDQFGAPTYALDIAEKTMEIVNKIQAGHVFESGIYHMCNSGVASWYDFAVKIFEYAQMKNIKVLPVSSAEYPNPVVRPQNSRLSCEKLYRTFGVSLRQWELALKECMNLHE